MDKAKAAVSDFLHRDGKHSTTVHESVNPAVQNEHVTRKHHENITTAVDREVHQDHFHTSVQPIHDKEVLPEKHTHNVAAVEHREHRHGDHDAIKQRLEAEAAQFKNTRTVGETQHSQTVAPTLQGEHVHHHIHENIQPVIQKETIQGNVVHTTVPIHEVHHNEPQHHTASALPAVSLHEFKKGGGVLSGRGEHTDAFEGKPRDIETALRPDGHHYIGGQGAKGTTHITNDDTAAGRGANVTGMSGHHNGGLTGSGSHGTGMTGSHGNGLTGTHDGTHRKADSGTGLGNHHDSTTTTKKPSLLDRINPMKDTDGDGKKGIME